MPDSSRRPADPDYAPTGDRVSFADGFPFLLALGGVARRAQHAAAARRCPMNRFRPNLVIAGGEPVRGGRPPAVPDRAIGFRVVKPCDRCVVTTTDQSTGAAGPRAAPHARRLPQSRRQGAVRPERRSTSAPAGSASERSLSGVNSRPMEVQIFGIRRAPIPARRCASSPSGGSRPTSWTCRSAPASPGELRRFAQKFGVERCSTATSRRFADLGLGAARLSDERWLDKLADEPLLLRMPLVRQQHRLTIGDAENDLAGVDRTDDPARPGRRRASSSARPRLLDERHLHRHPRRSLGHHRPERRREDDPLPPDHRRAGSRPAGTVARASGLRISLLDQHRDFAGADDRLGGGGRPVRGAARARAVAGRAGDRAGRGGRRASRRRRSRATTATSSGSSARAATRSRARIDAVLHGLGFDPDEARRRPLDGLSGGERGPPRAGAPAGRAGRRAPARRADQPPRSRDHAAGSRTISATLDATVLLISHDRAFLQAVVDHVLHLEAGTAATYDGELRGLRPPARRAAADASSAPFDKQRRAIAAEEDYIRRNIAGQNSAQAKGRRRRLERVARLEPAAGRGGRDGAPARGGRAGRRPGAGGRAASRLAIGERTLLARTSRRAVRRGEVVGLVGPERRREVHAAPRDRRRARARRRARSGCRDSIRIAYYRQDLAQVPADRTLYDIIADLRPAWGRGPIQGHLGRFGFSGDAVQRRAGTLSGGERARVALAMMMLSRRELPDLRRADQPSRRRIDRGAGGRDRGVRRHGAAGEPRPRAAPRAHHPHLGAARRADHRLRRRRSTSGRRRARSGSTRRRWPPRRRSRCAGCASGRQTRRPERRAQPQQSRAAERRARGRGRRGAGSASASGGWRRCARELEDPSLYLTPDGAAEAATGSASELERGAARRWTRRFAEWEAATRALEAIG